MERRVTDNIASVKGFRTIEIMGGGRGGAPGCDCSTRCRDTRLDGKLLRVPFSADQVQTFQIDGVVA